MKCLQVITNLGLGGGQNVMLSIIEALASRVSFTVFAVQGVQDGAVGRDMLDRLTALGVPVVGGTRLPMKAGGMVTGGVALARLLHRNRFDLVHTHTEIPEAATAIALALSPRSRRVPLVRTIHNTVLWPAWSGVGQWVESRLSHGAAAAVSNGALAALRAFRAQGGLPSLPPEATRVIFNGVRVPDAAGAADRAPGPVRLLYAGRFETQKGADLLPNILAQASVRRPGPVELDIVGRGGFAPRLAEALAGLGNGWTGTMRPPDPGLVTALGRYDAVLMPSRFEGLPLLSVEALVAGTPVLLTDAEGFSDVADPDYPLRAPAGDPSAFADLLLRFLSDPAGYRQVVAALRPAVVNRFHIDRMADAYHAFYSEAEAEAEAEAAAERR